MILEVTDNNNIPLTVNDDNDVNMRAGDVVNIATNSYNELEDKPTIEGVTVQGDLSLDDLNAYDKTEVDEKLAGKISVETDPTVPAWAKSPTKPSYTAQEVGALPNTTEIPTKVSQLDNDSGFITGYTETDPTVPSWAKAAEKPTYTANEVGALPDTTPIPAKTSDLVNDSDFITKEYVDDQDDDLRGRVFFGQVDGTSTSTVFTATIEGITKYVDGLAVMLKNGVVTSAAGFTININGLGAKPAYNNMAAASAETTLFNVNYTMLFVYDSTRIEGGAWILYRGYNSDNNTIGYQLRTNSYSLPAKDKFVRYRLLFTSADNTHFVPANTSTSTNATAKRDTNQTPINPFGPIVYYGTTAAVAAEARPGVGYLWQQYAVTLGYSFNRTNAALTLTSWAPVYIKCAPQSDGSAVIDSETPYVQALPSSKDGFIYIFLGVAYSATAVELNINHSVYYHDGNNIRIWTGEPITI